MFEHCQSCIQLIRLIKFCDCSSIGQRSWDAPCLNESTCPPLLSQTPTLTTIYYNRRTAEGLDPRSRTIELSRQDGDTERKRSALAQLVSFPPTNIFPLEPLLQNLAPHPFEVSYTINESCRIINYPLDDIFDIPQCVLLPVPTYQ